MYIFRIAVFFNFFYKLRCRSTRKARFLKLKQNLQFGDCISSSHLLHLFDVLSNDLLIQVLYNAFIFRVSLSNSIICSLFLVISSFMPILVPFFCSLSSSLSQSSSVSKWQRNLRRIIYHATLQTLKKSQAHFPIYRNHSLNLLQQINFLAQVSCQASEMERFVKIVNNFQPLKCTIFPKYSIFHNIFLRCSKVT